MKKNENKVANLIGNKVAQQLEGIKDATSKSKTTKAQGTKKTKAQLVEESPTFTLIIRIYLTILGNMVIRATNAI